MRRSSLSIRFVSLLLSAVLIAACTSSEAFKGSSSGINTLNVFFSEVEVVADDNVMGVYIFNPGSNKTTLRAQHKLGSDFAIEMDTNRDKEGYEYLAFVGDGEDNSESVYLMDYDKDSNKIYTLWSYSSEICAIFPELAGNQEIFDASDRHQAKLVHLKRIVAEIPLTPSDSCSDEDKLLVSLSFEEGLASDDIERKQQSYLVRDTLIDYAYVNRVTNENGVRVTKRGRFAFLGDNGSGTISLYDDEGRTFWTANSPDPDSPIFALQTDNETVLLQTDTDLYVGSISSIFEVDQLDPDQIPQNLSDLLFEISGYELGAPGSSELLHHRKNEDDFVLRDGDDLVLYADEEFQLAYSAPVGIQSFDFYLTANSTVLVLQRFPTYQTLVTLEKIGNVWTTSTAILEGNNAEEIRLDVIDNELYISTFNLGSGDSGWQAHYFETPSAEVITYDNSIFIVNAKVDSPDREAYIFSSDETDSNDFLLEPGMFVFDRTQDLGKELMTGSGGKIVTDQDGIAIPVSFGNIPATVSSLGNMKTVNRQYSYFQTLNEMGQIEFYFVDLSERIDGSLKFMLAQ